jgi:hypothetical protein
MDIGDSPKPQETLAMSKNADTKALALLEGRIQIQVTGLCAAALGMSSGTEYFLTKELREAQARFRDNPTEADRNVIEAAQQLLATLPQRSAKSAGLK